MNKLIAKALLSGVVVSTVALSGPAMAGDKCDAPKDEWQSEEAFRQEIEAKGWEIRKFKIDDGCYEIYGYDEEARKVEAYFDPKTFEMVKMERED
jgi:hypothetical protein